MPRPKKPLPAPKPGYIYTGAMSKFIILKVVAKPVPKVVVYVTASGRKSTIREDQFLAGYGLRACQTV